LLCHFLYKLREENKYILSYPEQDTGSEFFLSYLHFGANFTPEESGFGKKKAVLFLDAEIKFSVSKAIFIYIIFNLF